MDNFSIGLMCLSTSGYYTQSKFLQGTVEKNSSTIRSSGRNRTYACAMPVHCFGALCDAGAYCIQFQRMQFHMIRSFFHHLCLKNCVFLRIRRSKAIISKNYNKLFEITR